MNNKLGMVYLIGAGPGDPGLLTLKAKACIENADVVVYDYLASPHLLNHAKEGAEIIYVGKKGGDHTLSQDKISQLIADKGLAGSTVARLKGGDPFIFGRGGEEAELLIDQGVPFEIVPGVTSAIAAPAYAGIPLTHREHASSVSLITGHEDPLKPESSIRWDALAKSGSTLVFLMGVKNLANITGKLIENGKSPDTPVALVRWGTTAKQVTVTGTLTTIVDVVKKAGLKAPAVTVVGDVVSLREKMKWFEQRPLLGKKIVVTRARAQASDLVKRLSDLGADCIEMPVIKIVPAKEKAPLMNAVRDINYFDWVIFTSVNGVKYFFEALFDQGKDVRALGQLKFACIGPVTKKALRDFGINTDILPETYRAESVVEAFASVTVKEKRFLIPRAKQARTVLPEELKKMGGIITEINAYETIQADAGSDDLVSLLKKNQIDVVTFTSSSTVNNFMELIGKNRASQLLDGVVLASIGPITSDTAKALGLTPQISADTYTIPGLVDAICHYCENRKAP